MMTNINGKVVSNDGDDGVQEQRDSYSATKEQHVYNSDQDQQGHEEAAPKQETTTNENKNKKICRICLEEEEEDVLDNAAKNPPSTNTNTKNGTKNVLLSPCLCKGNSKYVHRTCLDEWRACQEDRAFSKCTECLFEYYMEPTKLTSNDKSRRRRYIYFVMRDLVGLLLGLQVCIILLGAFIGLMDRNNRYFSHQVMSCGGTYIDAFEDTDAENDDTTGGDTTNNNSSSLLESFTNISSTLYNYNGTTTTTYDEDVLDDVVQTDDYDDDDAVCVYGTYYLFGLLLFLAVLGIYGLFVLGRNGWSQQDAMHDARTYNYGATTTAASQRGTTHSTTTAISGGGGHRRCCGSSSTHHAATDGCFYGCYFGGCCDCDSCCPCSGDSGCDNECCCCFVLVFGAIAAVIGVVYFILFGIVISQQIFQRHLFLLKKKRLVTEYRVLDLSTYKDNKDDTTNLTTIQDELRQQEQQKITHNRDHQSSSLNKDDDGRTTITNVPPENLEMNDRGNEKDDCGKKQGVKDNSMLSSISTRLSQSDIQQLKTLGLME